MPPTAMINQSFQQLLTSRLFSVLCLVLVMAACTRSWDTNLEPWEAVTSSSTQVPAASVMDNPYITQRPAGFPILTPTPDEPHPIPGMRMDSEQYTVQAGDTLGKIAADFRVSVEAIAEANDLEDVNVLEIGQVLAIPAPEPVVRGPAFKIIPDSELVAGPVTAFFDVADFTYSQNGYLVNYEEDVEGVTLRGYQIVQRVGQEYSVNPRLLLALLEYQSAWLSNANPRTYTLDYTMGWQDPNRAGLYRQLAWAANELNRGYYLWRVNAVGTWVLPDGLVVPIDPTINAGTAAIQHFFSKLYNSEIWERSVTEDGFFSTYQELFGYPFDYSFDPILPPDLAQPPMQLPFEKEIDWAFTGGPHGGWGDGSAWAALDFAPHGEPLGCVQSDNWVTAVADGLVVRAADGAVVQDLDGDGLEQTGWTVLYMHIETRDRVEAGVPLQAGDRIGHPSCEGGVSSGTHVHIARRYNGEWIPADQDHPFVLNGWVSTSTGSEYEGRLQKNDRVVIAESGRSTENIIQR
jgi:LysM repeat protein